MEKLIKILVIALVILTGCKTTRKITESSEIKSSERTETISTTKELKDFKEDKDVNSELETVTEETVTEFYRSVDSVKQGAVKTLRTIRTVKTKKDSDKSKIAATSTRQEAQAIKEEKATVVIKEVKSVKKTGVSQLKVIAGLVAVLLFVYFLVRMKIIKIPFMTKAVEWINRLLGLNRSKAA